jgi:hydroxyethylthiazole kinase-like uncharacterized protein yjeF
LKTATVDGDFVRSALPKRDENGHKGDFGKVYILAGSRGFTGAPAFAARAAVRAGAGLVYLGVPECVYAIEAVKNDEAMVSPLRCFEDGMLSDLAVPAILDAASGCGVIAAGPGLGRGDGVKAAAAALVKWSGKPLVLDADALFAVKDDEELLKNRNELTVLTPHEGEFARLGYGGGADTREKRALAAAKELRCVVVLKGHRTLTAFPDGRLFVNTTGNSGMAKGGSGDVLTGVIAALLAQGIAPDKAVPAAVWLHGRAGDIAAERLGEYSMTPTDMLGAIPEAMKDY